MGTLIKIAPSIRITVMERNQSREISSNGVLRHIACGVAGFMDNAIGGKSQPSRTSENHSNMDLPHTTIPGASHSATGFATSGIKRNKEKGNDTKSFEGEVMKTLWKKLHLSKVSDYDIEGINFIETFITRKLGRFYRGLDEQDQKEISQYGGSEIRETRWTSKIFESPHPSNTYLFWKYIKKHRDKKCLEKVDFIIVVNGKEYKFGDDDKNSTQYTINYDKKMIETVDKNLSYVEELDERLAIDRILGEEDDTY